MINEEEQEEGHGPLHPSAIWPAPAWEWHKAPPALWRLQICMCANISGRHRSVPVASWLAMVF